MPLFYFNSIGAIDGEELKKRIEEIQTKLQKPQMDLSKIYDTKLKKINQTFQEREQQCRGEGGSFLQRRLDQLQLDYYKQIQNIYKEYQSKL